MITITIKLSPGQNGEPDSLDVQGYSTKCPGVVVTRPLLYWRDGKPVFSDNSWVLTHKSSGYKISNYFHHIQGARDAAKRLSESGLDFTQSIQYIQDNYHQYKNAILEASKCP